MKTRRLARARATFAALERIMQLYQAKLSIRRVSAVSDVNDDVVEFVLEGPQISPIPEGAVIPIRDLVYDSDGEGRVVCKGLVQ